MRVITVEKLLTRYESDISCREVSVGRFADAVQKDPAYTLSWSQDIFAAAAEIRILKQVVDYLKHEVEHDSYLNLKNEVDYTAAAPVSNLIDMLTDKVIHGAMYPSFSSSTTCNLISQYETASAAMILSNLRSMVAVYDDMNSGEAQ
jgi:hypothetical protein